MANPLVADVVVGLTKAGRAQRSYLNCLLVQAGVLFLWWPKSHLFGRLETQAGPDTLAAVSIATSVTIAYYSMRAGAEEVLLPGQHSLWEWALATPLKIGRILRGYLLGHLLQTLHALALSSPLLLMGFAVSAGRWSGLCWSLVAIVFQALFYRLLGAVMYFAIGHRELTMFYALRAVLVTAYLIGAILVPATSYWAVAFRTLAGNGWLPDGGTAWSGLAGFLLVHALLSALLAWVLYLLLMHRRNTAAGPTANSA